MQDHLPRVQPGLPGPGEAPHVVERDLEGAGAVDQLAPLLAGDPGALLLPGALGATRAEAIAAWLEAHPGPAGPLHTPPFPGRTYGSVLVIAGAERAAYHDHAAALVQACAAMPEDPLAVLLAALSRLAGGAPVRPPVGARGPYAPATVRVLDPGAHVAIHSERDTWPSMDEVRAQARCAVQLSCYAPLRMGADGGELVLYHRPPDGQAPHIGGLDDREADRRLAVFGTTLLRPRPGDLLVFAGGRYNHQVRPATRGQRWTLGCFLAPAAEGGGYLAWS